MLSPEDALNILDGVASNVQMNRQSHAACVDAVNTLRRLISEHDSKAGGGRTTPTGSSDSPSRAMGSKGDGPNLVKG